MNLYVDDHMAGSALVGRLRKAGHVVVRPADVQQSGTSDARHLEYAILHGLALLSADRRDFWELHDVIQASGGLHFGILIVRFDNDPLRDMKPQHIAGALVKLQRAGVPVENQLIVLNHWR